MQAFEEKVGKMKTISGITERREKVVMILHTHVVENLKDRAQRENRTISDVIEEAVLRLSEDETNNLRVRQNAVKNFCSNPFKLSTVEVEELMNQDPYEV